MKSAVHWFLLIAMAIGYTLNIVGIYFGVSDLLSLDLTTLEQLRLVGVTALRIAGLPVIPLGAVLGYF
jgi:hypothetical protein